MQGVSKRYGGVRALQDAQLAIEAGRIHAVLGENGAGKSTLIKIMAGVVAPDEGRMTLEGREVSFPDPAAANQAGVVCIADIRCDFNQHRRSMRHLSRNGAQYGTQSHLTLQIAQARRVGRGDVDHRVVHQRRDGPARSAG